MPTTRAVWLMRDTAVELPRVVYWTPPSEPTHSLVPSSLAAERVEPLTAISAVVVSTELPAATSRYIATGEFGLNQILLAGSTKARDSPYASHLGKTSSPPRGERSEFECGVETPCDLTYGMGVP